MARKSSIVEEPTSQQSLPFDVPFSVALEQLDAYLSDIDYLRSNLSASIERIRSSGINPLQQVTVQYLDRADVFKRLTLTLTL